MACSKATREIFSMSWLKHILTSCQRIFTTIDRNQCSYPNLYQSIKNPYMSFSPPHCESKTTSCSVTHCEQRRGLFHNALLISTELQLCTEAAQLPQLLCVMLQSPACNACILTIGCGQSEARELWQPAALSATVGKKKKALKHKSLLGKGDIKTVFDQNRHI